MKEQPLISVIVPVYNLEKFISRTVLSIMTQTYEKIELIMVDDGSNDRSWYEMEVCRKKYPDKIKLVRQNNSGVTLARLNGIVHAKGEWIGFVDGDDEIEKDMYELLLKNALKYNALISHCGYQMIFEDGRVNYFHNTGVIIKQENIKGVKDLLEGTVIEPGLCNKLYHKSLFRDLIHTDIMDTNIKINEDLLMNFYLFSNSTLSVFQDVCKYHYLIRNDSASRSSLTKHKIYDPIYVKEKILQEATLDVKETAEKALISTCLDVYNTLLVAGHEYKEDLFTVKNIMKRYKRFMIRLSCKRRFMVIMCLGVPRIYKFIYMLYICNIQRNRYK